MKRTMRKNFVRELSSSKPRFFSIMILMFLSCFIFVGLKMTGPDIRATAEEYLVDYNLADIFATSTLGFDQTEIDLISSQNQYDVVEYDYFSDTTIGDTNQSVRIFSQTDNISKYELVSGKLPSEEGQIAISNEMQDDYKIGDTITFTEKDGSALLKNDEFEVVGFVNSTEILSNINLGISTVGSGELNGYGVVTDDNFDSDVYTIIRASIADENNVSPFTESYHQAVNEESNNLETALTGIGDERLTAIKEDAQSEISEGKQEIADAKKELNEAQDELDEAKLELDDAKVELDDAKQTIVDNEQQLIDSQAKIDGGKNELQSNKHELESNKQKVTDGLKQAKSGLVQINDGLEQVTAKQSEIDQAKEQLVAGKNQYETAIADLENQKAAIEQTIASGDLSEEQLAEQQGALQQIEAGIETTNNEYQTFLESTYNPNISSIESGQVELDASKSTLDSQKSEVTNTINELNSNLEQINSGLITIASKENELVDAQTEVDNGKIELEQGKEDYESGLAKYNDGLAEYEDGLDEFTEQKEEAETEIAKNEKKLEDAEKDLDDLERPEYTVNTRLNFIGSDGYNEYDNMATSIDQIANVFPIILFLVAALVIFTTMTRFVEDSRVTSGTLISLGYTDSQIISKFVLYGFIASITGAILGSITGAYFIPYIIYQAFAPTYTLPDIVYTFDPVSIALALIIATICSVVPALLVAKKEFVDSPASLLLPKPPASGSKIFLERVTPIWNRLSFAHKVTARNIFRYKKRMFMTIFGVCGSVALLFAGLAMQGSIAGINDLQFGQIMNYDMIVSVNDDLTKAEQNDINELLANGDINSYDQVQVESMTVTNSNGEPDDLTVMIGNNKLEDFMTLRDRKTQEEITLKDGLILTEKFANVMDEEIGDSQALEINGEDYNFEVADIAEMYMGHFGFMSNEYYKQITGNDSISNSYIIKLNDSSSENVKKVASSFMELEGVNMVSQNTTMISQVDVMVASLNTVMKVLIIIATLLAVVILYNLTNINVSERIRELSTTRVLGYYDLEVTFYIYRETIILSAIGILVGYILGNLLHKFLINSVAPSYLMFDPSVDLYIYIVPMVIIVVVTIILGFIINYKLSRVDMLEALKSVE